MTLLHIISYAAIVAAFAFVTLSLASGLLYISELIEEHSRLSKVIGQRGIYVVLALHALLYFFDSLPLPQILFSSACHVVYLQNFSSTWPLISLTSWSFVASCILVIADHFLWFFYFSRITHEFRQTSHVRTYRPPTNVTKPLHIPGFADIATFFAICVWLVPLFLFLSLSANDNALPTSASGYISEPSTPISQRPPLAHTRSSLFKSLFESLPRMRSRSRRKDASEGLIAPRSPNPARPGSPSPALARPPQSPIPSSPTHFSGRAFEGDAHLSPHFKLSTPPRNVRRAATSDGVGLGLRRTPSADASGFVSGS